MVLDVVNQFRCRHRGREINKLQEKVQQDDDNSWD